MQVERTVREHHALGSAGGAAGIEKLADGVLVEEHDIGTVDAAARQQFLVVGARFYEALNAGAGGTEMIDQRGKIGLIDQDARRGVIQNGAEFKRRKPYVERHHDGAGERHSEIAFQKLMGIEAQVGNTIPLLDAFREQAGRQALAAFAELRVCETVLPANYAFFAAVKVDGAVQTTHRREGHVHLSDCTAAAYWKKRAMRARRRSGFLSSHSQITRIRHPRLRKRRWLAASRDWLRSSLAIQ